MGIFNLLNVDLDLRLLVLSSILLALRSTSFTNCSALVAGRVA